MGLLQNLKGKQQPFFCSNREKLRYINVADILSEAENRRKDIL